MELDETDPAVWLKLEAAVEEYIQNNSLSFKSACERLLLPFQQEDKLSANLRSQYLSKAKPSNAGIGIYFFLNSSLYVLLFWIHFCLVTYNL